MTSKLGKIKLAWDVYNRYLDGVFCIYKPTGFTTMKAIEVLRKNIAKDLNKLPMFESEREQYQGQVLPLSSAVEHKERLPASIHDNHTLPMNISNTQQNTLKYKLVYGDVFMTDDIDLRYLHGLRMRSSGVLLIGIGREGKQSLEMIGDAKYLRVYHVKGRFGFATDNFYFDGKFIERSTYHHVTQGKVDKVCSAAQSGHQRLMFEYAGVNPHSQEAYELACGGIIRPASLGTPPILYGVKCIYFNPPDFTLEIHAINETCDYLAELVNDIGLRLKTNAVCVHVHRIRHGYYRLENTLLHKNWHVDDIISNIKECDKHLTPRKLLTDLRVRNDERESETFDSQFTLDSADGPTVKEILRLHGRSDTSVHLSPLKVSHSHKICVNNSEHVDMSITNKAINKSRSSSNCDKLQIQQNEVN